MMKNYIFRFEISFCYYGNQVNASFASLYILIQGNGFEMQFATVHYVSDSIPNELV